jgi:hypothetical protein
LEVEVEKIEETKKNGFQKLLGFLKVKFKKELPLY